MTFKDLVNFQRQLLLLIKIFALSTPQDADNKSFTEVFTKYQYKYNNPFDICFK